MRIIYGCWTVAVLLACMPLQLKAAADVPLLDAVVRMPVKEVAVFKDGHAYISHQGSLPTDTEGNIAIDYLPSPVLGSFWLSVTQKGVKLSAVTAGQRRVTVQRTPQNVRELIEANTGVDVFITEITSEREQHYPASIVRVLNAAQKNLRRQRHPTAATYCRKRMTLCC
jgi:hypothetical protein